MLCHYIICVYALSLYLSRLPHNDPGYKAGIYAHTYCQEFVAAAGALTGGKTW